MSLEYVTLTGTLPNPLQGAAVTGVASFVLSGWTPAAADDELFPPAAAPVAIMSGEQWSAQLLANDSSDIPPGSFWTVTFLIDQIAFPFTFSFVLNHADGAEQDIAGLAHVEPTASMAAYMLLTGGQFLGAVAPAVVDLADGPVISINAAAGNLFRVTLGGDRVLADPSGAMDGQLFRLEVVQDATGGRTLSYGAEFDFGAVGAVVLSTAPHARDVFGIARNADAGTYEVLAFAPGYQ